MSMILQAQKKVPALRFPGFEGAWEEKRLGSVTVWSSGGTPSKGRKDYWDGEIPWISASSMRGNEFYDSELKITEEGLKRGSRLAPEGSILILVRGSMLFKTIPVGLAMRDVAFNQDVKCIKIKQGIEQRFLLFWFIASENKLMSLVTGTGIGAGKLDLDDLKSFELISPPLPEQQKIAAFLTAIDTRIQQLTRKVDLLEQYKKGVMQKIFAQEIRFKDDQGRDFPDWEEKILGEISSPIKRKAKEAKSPVLTISAGAGFLRQKDRFNKVIAGTSLKNYNVLRRNEFSYNRGNSKSFTYGCIYRLKDYDEALVPFVYRSFKLKKGVPGFFEQLFEFKYLDRKLRRLISSSARMDGLLNIGEKDFYNVKVLYPCIEEQQKIAAFLTAIDRKITHTKGQLEHMQRFKKGLLQQMFV